MQDLFNTAPIVVKQPKRFFIDESEYHCYDRDGRHLAHVHEVGLDGGMKALRFMAGNTAGFARKLMVNDAWRRPRLYIEKSWSLWTASTTIAHPDGTPIGYIDQDFKLFKAGFRLLDPWKRHLGTIKGDFWGFDFKIVDHTDHEVAKVNRQVADLGDLFTAADTYVLWPRYPTLPEPLRTLVIASGITVDLVLAEGKR
ncbi:scramblase [Streptomonospora sp. S1-112]|uniref:Scramblase n=1 Tax=Streptomonospora mangrovi TaxID=2883123 RepID=A0A9X3SG83_9ACTN|nr:phospholipid scramblase-related protein [Streptomonospora mangrovi]MDA0566622.1 scramblase [Streptomonospora mangrovi]